MKGTRTPSVPSYRTRPTSEFPPPAHAQAVLHQLRAGSLILEEDWDLLPAVVAEELMACDQLEALLPGLVEHGLLTEYQAMRVHAGKTFGLLLGNYRVLDRLGAGGMGLVFKAEHVRMRRPVAIKVLPQSLEQDPRLLSRFYGEMRAVAQLHHPNIVGAFDAGEVASPDPGGPVLHYMVMEYVAGQNLEDLVVSGGPLPVVRACDLAYQVASALAEAHRHRLVHRDVKPSNVLVAPDGQAKLLDFGLARHFRTRLTEPGTVLGSIDFMAPEQARDSSSVDIRADIYGLGGTLFWCLAGRTPFVPRHNIAEELVARLTQPPPSVRFWQPQVPAELDAVVARMMAVNPDARYPTPEAVMRVLLGFLRVESPEHVVAARVPAGVAQRFPVVDGSLASPRAQQVLIVDDDPSIRTLCQLALEGEGLLCEEAANGRLGLEKARARRPDVLLLDVNMPDLDGPQVLRQLRADAPCANLKVIMFSGQATGEELAQLRLAGADDYLSKPFTVVQLRAQVKAALRLKDAQDRSDLLAGQLFSLNRELERSVDARDSDLIHARNALVLALAKMVEYRDSETGAHLLRLQNYCRGLAQEAAAMPMFAAQIDPNFIAMLVCCAPLHDIGKVGLPDHILLKPGKLEPDERIIMQAHTTIGADTLKAVAKEHGSAVAFLQMAIDIARHHHERYDGKGYPDHLAGDAIPLAARVVTIADVYDALRSRRSYKPALSHAAALQLMTEASPGHFDPALLHAFQRCAYEFEQVFRELTD